MWGLVGLAVRSRHRLATLSGCGGVWDWELRVSGGSRRGFRGSRHRVPVAYAFPVATAGGQ